MIRYSQINKLLARSRYIIDHRKPRVESNSKISIVPSNKVPKYVYEVKYHPQANPGIDLGFPDHRHTNPFQDVAGAKHENFRYRYYSYIYIDIQDNGGKDILCQSYLCSLHLLPFLSLWPISSKRT
jgi:hypothetical protein